jgi:RecJ-like exonuclease
MEQNKEYTAQITSIKSFGVLLKIDDETKGLIKEEDLNNNS